MFVFFNIFDVGEPPAITAHPQLQNQTQEDTMKNIKTSTLKGNRKTIYTLTRLLSTPLQANTILYLCLKCTFFIVSCSTLEHHSWKHLLIQTNTTMKKWS